MKPKLTLGIAVVVLLAAISLRWAPTARAATTIDPVNRYAYGANIGWMDWYADGANGAVVNDYYCYGYLWAANVGWLNLGSGTPANGIRYQNLSAGDFGVNNDGLGNLRGYAWGANIGWLNFENTGAPKVDIRTGKFSGYVWSANCGWLSLSNAFAFVQTDHILPGPLDANGLPIPWELANFGVTGVDPNADPDHDGMSNRQEYLAGTNPNDPNDYLRLTVWNYGFGLGGTTATLTWSSVPTRCYYIEETLNLLPPSAWADSGLGVIAPDDATTTRSFMDANAPMRYYRVEAVRPLP